MSFAFIPRHWWPPRWLYEWARNLPRFNVSKQLGLESGRSPRLVSGCNWAVSGLTGFGGALPDSHQSANDPEADVIFARRFAF